MKNLVMSSAAILAVVASATVSAAAVTTSPGIGSMNVTAEVTAGCSDLTVSDLDFGTSPAAGIDIDVPVNISVTCNSGAAYTVELDYGLNVAGTKQRQVTNADNGEFIDYDIFQPTAGGAAATSALWGDAANNEEFSSIGTGSAQVLTATGRLHLADTNSPGIYTDLVTVTLNF